MQEKTSSGYDILYPQTIAAQIEDVYSKDETITTATKALYGLGETATPNQVFSAISTALDGKARIQTGSYVGTGTYGASNPCSLTFEFEPKALIINRTYVSSESKAYQIYVLALVYRNSQESAIVLSQYSGGYEFTSRTYQGGSAPRFFWNGNIISIEHDGRSEYNYFNQDFAKYYFYAF